MIDLGVVCLDKSKHVAPNFMKVGQRGYAASLHFVRSFSIQR